MPAPKNPFKAMLTDMGQWQEKGIDIDAISEEINIVPTINEALDILQMDAIERDLGF